MPAHHERPSVLLELLALAGLAALAGVVLNARTRKAHDGPAPKARRRSTPRAGMAAISPDVAESTADGEPCDYVRPAGPEAMRDAPRHGWDAVDEASDESFPASDATARY